jgi:hypothetical protein
VANSAEVAALPLKSPCLLRSNIDLRGFSLWNGCIHAQLRDNQSVCDIIGSKGERYLFAFCNCDFCGRKGESLSMDLNDLRLLLSMYRGSLKGRKTQNENSYVSDDGFSHVGSFGFRFVDKGPDFGRFNGRLRRQKF